MVTCAHHAEEQVGWETDPGMCEHEMKRVREGCALGVFRRERCEAVSGEVCKKVYLPCCELKRVSEEENGRIKMIIGLKFIQTYY